MSRILENPFKAAIKLHDPLALEHLGESRKALASYCLKPDTICKAYLNLALEVSRSLALTRLYDLRGLREYMGLDAEIIKLLDRIVDIYSKLLAGLLVIVDGDVMVRFKATVEVKGRLYRRGDIAKLNLGDFIVLALADLVEPFESVASLS